MYPGPARPARDTPYLSMESKTMSEEAKTVKSGTKEDKDREGELRISPAKLGITMDKRVDLAVAVVVVLLGIFMLITSRNIRLGAIRDPLGTRALPDIVGTFITIIGIVLVVNRIRTWSALPGHFVVEEGKKDEEGHPATWVRAFSIVTTMLLWVLLLNPLGYLFNTLLSLAAVSLIMGDRSWSKVIVYPIIYTVVTWYVFSQPLQIMLPLGPLTHFARSLGLTP